MDLHHLLLAGLPAHSALPQERTSQIHHFANDRLVLRTSPEAAIHPESLSAIKTKGHVGIKPHGDCPLHSVQVAMPVQGLVELPALQANEHALTNPAAANSFFSNLQG